MEGAVPGQYSLERKLDVAISRDGCVVLGLKLRQL